MSKPLKLKTYTSKELKMIIPALGTFIRPLLYQGRHIASCAHYSGDCSYCPLDNNDYNLDICDTIHIASSGDVEDHIDSDNKLFPSNFIENHPEYLI